MSRTRGSLALPLTVAGTALALSLSACGGGEASTASADTGITTRSVGTAFGQVQVPERPTRVVTLAESALDTALAVGVTPVGTTASRGGDAPPAYLGAAAEKIPVVGTVREANLEEVVKADPDLILVAPTTPKAQYDALSAIAPTVAPKAAPMTEWEAPLRTYAEAMGRTDALTTKLDDVERRTQALARNGKATGSFAVLRWMPNGAVVMNSGLMASALLTEAGGSPVRAAGSLRDQPHSDPLSLENLGQVDADRIFVATMDAEGKSALEAARRQPAFARLRAASTDAVTPVDGGVWSSSSGPIAASEVLDDVEAASP